MVDSALIILLTGIALVVSGIVQATLYGLTVYHGLVLLALSWLTLLAAIPPYVTLTFHRYERPDIVAEVVGLRPQSAGNTLAALSHPPRFPRNSSPAEISAPTGGAVPRVRQGASLSLLLAQLSSLNPISGRLLMHSPKFQSLIALHSFHLSFTSAFGLWLFARMRTFDISPSPICTSSTLYNVYGYTWPVLNNDFRRFALVLYGSVLFPGYNALLVNAAVLGSSFVVPIIWIIVHIPVTAIVTSEKWARYRESSLVFLAAFATNAPLLVIVITIILSLEETISVNQVAPGEDIWNLGQTLALLLSCFSLLDFGKWVYTTKGLCAIS